MNLRSSAKAAATSLGLARLPVGAAPDEHSTKGRMKLGTQHGSTDEILRPIAALGVTHICSSLLSAKFDETWSVERLTRLRERVESFEIQLESGPVSSEEMWERITDFLQCVVSAAEQYKVKLACHPHDPGMPGEEGFRGVRKKIFNVHFRNIHGRFLNFQETFPDAGDVDMLRAVHVYKKVGYDGMLMPDHVPIIQGDEGGRQAFAFGCIRGLMQAADA